MKNLQFKKHYLKIIFLITVNFGYCQNDNNPDIKLPNIVPPTPEVASLGKYLETPVSEFTGIPKIGMPIYNIQQGRINHSVNLSYHAQGVKVEEIASRVGMGWTLNAGGVIHRQMRKLPDNVQYGYLRNNETVEDLSNAVANPYDCTAHDYVVNMFLYYHSNFQRDFEPDLFTFSFGGYSGRFYYNQQTGEPLIEEASPLKIEWIDYEYNHESPSHQQNYNYFKITTPDGLEYYFGVNKDKTDYAKIYKGGEDMEDVYTTGPYGSSIDETESSNYARYVSTWYLMEIYDPINKSSVTFEYDVFDLGRVTRRLATSVIVEEHLFTPVVNVTYEKQISEQYEEEYALSKINYKQGSIEFISDTQDRQDLSGAYALKGIDISDINNNLIKSFGLEHFFSNNNHGNSDMSSYHLSSNDIKHRLFLSELKEYEIDHASNSIITSNFKSHSFEYHNPNSLPHRLSTAQDFWGFHNNADGNTNLMPLNSDVFGTSGSIIQLGEADRSVNETYSKDGVLTKITYPTGGYTVYNYENNTARKNIPIQSFCEVSPTRDPLTYEPDNYQDINYSFNETNPDEYYGGSAPYYVMYFDIGDVPTPGLNLDQIVNFNYTNYNNGYVDEPYWEAYIQKKENGVWPSSHMSPRVYNFNDSGSNEVALDINAEYRIIINWINDESGPWNPNNTGGSNGYGDHTPDWDLLFTVTAEAEDNTIDSNVYVTGGLRIKEIKTSDLGGNTYTTTYSYIDHNDETTGHLVSLPYRFSDTWVRPNSQAGASSNDGATFYKYSSGITAALASTQGSYTGYSRVTRINEDGGNGKIEFNFSFERDDCNFSTVYNNSYGSISGNSSWAVANAPLLNEELQRGKLLSKIEYNAQGIKVKELTNTYELKTYQEQKAYIYKKWGHTVWGGTPNSPSCNNDTAIINEYTLKSRSNFLKRELSTVYDINGANPITTTTNYFYDNDIHLQPTRIVSSNSKGEVITQETTYAHEEGDTRLINEHRITEPIRTKVYNETSLLSETRTFYQDDDGLYLPKTIQTAKNGDSFEDRITYHHYDAFGNPLEVSKTNGASISYIWGYNNQYPIAKVENASYSEIESLPQFGIGFEILEGLTIAQENELRSNLPNAQVSTYTYAPLIGMTSQTDPRGYTMYYEYDELNRLKHVKDQDGNILSENEYNYRIND